MYHNTRHSARNNKQANRYNNTGTFVPAAAHDRSFYEESFMEQEPIQQNQWNQGIQIQNMPDNYEASQNNETFNQNNTVVATSDTSETANGGKTKPKWMNKGIKLSMREKRRRQNLQLRRLLTPKNAQMVLNELVPGTQHECTVLPDEAFGCQANKQYVAVVNVEGVEYKGTGTSKINAKTVAAENAIRDLMIKKINKINQGETMTSETTEVNEASLQQIPMMQLASFALHKLFAEWQAEGYKVPQLTTATKPAESAPGTPTPGKGKKIPVLPANPETLHPCMLLGQMRPGIEYTIIGCEGLKPNSQVFTMGVMVDGMTFIGKGQNKKEARRLAAKKACEEIFKIQYVDVDMQVVEA